MNLHDVLVRYLNLLCSQMEHDAAILSKPWVYITLVPFVWYLLVAFFKWYILLAPITVPLTFFPTIKQVVSMRPDWLKGKPEKN